VLKDGYESQVKRDNDAQMAGVTFMFMGCILLARAKIG
jgi:hypothetical protein